jgi:hypothetical protein
VVAYVASARLLPAPADAPAKAEEAAGHTVAAT